MIDIQNESEQKIVDYVIRDQERLSGKRGGFESQWREIAQRIFPSGSHTFNPDSSMGSQGQRKTNAILDPTASIAINRFAAILDSLLTPRNQTWHKLATNNAELAKNRQVKLYFEQATEVLFKYRYSPKANFASQNQKNYKSLGGFGTGCLFIDQLYGETGVRYKGIHLGQIYFDENHQGMVDKAVRVFPLTVRQAVKQFGEDALPQMMKNDIGKNDDKEYRFIHHVAARGPDFDPTRLDSKGKPFASYYVCKDARYLVREEGYTSFPFAVSRYEQTDEEIYGRSPAMEVLPAIKTLNEQKRILLMQGHRSVSPVLLTHDDGIIVDMTPGAMNHGGMTADGRSLIGTLPVGNVNIGKDMMEMERAHINDAFLVTLFQILMDSPQMTATEVLERTKEKGILLAPTIGRQQTEYLGPMIEREIDLLASQGLMPEMPGILKEAQGEYTIAYVSPLTRAQQAEEAAGLSRTLEMALNVANVTQDPSILFNFDFDVAIPEIAEIQGVPARWLKDAKAVMQMKQAQAQQQQIQQQIQAAPAAAAMAKTQAQTRR